MSTSTATKNDTCILTEPLEIQASLEKGEASPAVAGALISVRFVGDAVKGGQLIRAKCKLDRATKLAVAFAMERQPNGNPNTGDALFETHGVSVDADSKTVSVYFSHNYRNPLPFAVSLICQP
ncbi:MAG: hypothetical protein IPJ49_29225 [Candidatus Obscuribacter sp.]|jgi:hypothetical protein|nr:hypothetical protein [Candidatus Obscuribacter sp.]